MPQDAYLFQGTVGDNLLVAGDGAADGVADAADRLGLSRLVAANPEGLAVEIAVAGRDLPLAHRQAISLLRAYLGDQSLIVLDEATSALDVVTEARVLDAFRQKCADGLLVVVSHRLDNIGPQDSVVRLTDGSIIDGPSVDYPSTGDSGNHYSTGGPPLTRTGQQERSDP